jgi:hypothetical protein
MTAMTDLLLGPMLRHVGRTHATVWMELDAAAEVEIEVGALCCTARSFGVAGHHYALVVVEGLAPDSQTAYVVRIEGRQVWPPVESTQPASMIRTLSDSRPLRILTGSCRTAAPHEPPWSLEADQSSQGRGIDALRAHGLRMLGAAPETWPDLILMVGDQVYADDTSPEVRRRIDARRTEDGLPEKLVANFEEYTWLYRESWTPEIERWLLSTVPSAMIFDDHDMIDDWNISASWVRDTRALPWWEDHVTGGLVSYWIYQHLGNLSPDELRDEGLLDRLAAVDDGEAILREWARQSESFTPIPGGYRFSFFRDLGSTRLVVIDCRNGRVLEPNARAMVDDDEWAWVVNHACVPCEHLLLATSVPVFVPGGLHGLQQWNEALCDGAWGRPIAGLSERLRRALDLEDWCAFSNSFRAFVELLTNVANGDGPAQGNTRPRSITVLSGDIHFSYQAEIQLARPGSSRVNQIVSSPIRNALAARDRKVLRFGVSRVGRKIGTWLQRAARVPHTDARWELANGPFFHSGMAELRLDGPSCTVVFERAQPDEDGQAELSLVATVDLTA